MHICGYGSCGKRSLAKARASEFARHAGESRPLSPEQLGQLATQMVETQDPAEADRLQAEIVRGFYGDEPHA